VNADTLRPSRVDLQRLKEDRTGAEMIVAQKRGKNEAMDRQDEQGDGRGHEQQVAT